MRILPALILFLTAGVFFTGSLSAAENRKPNVVILLADDLRPDGLAALGHPVVKTPNLDPLVKNGYIFRRCYTMGSMIGAVCLPSRTMLLTGQSMFRIKNEPSGATRDELRHPSRPMTQLHCNPFVKYSAHAVDSLAMRASFRHHLVSATLS